MAKNHAAAEDIVSYLNAYLKHMKAIQEKTNPSNKCYESDQAIIDYWENIKSLFAAEEGWATNSGLPLQDGFWPRTNHGTGYKRPHDGVQDSAQVDEDLLAREAEEELVERNEIFVGNPSEMERERFVPLVDIEPGVMLLIRPCDGFVVKDCFWWRRLFLESFDNAGLWILQILTKSRSSPARRTLPNRSAKKPASSSQPGGASQIASTSQAALTSQRSSPSHHDKQSKEDELAVAEDEEPFVLDDILKANAIERLGNVRRAGLDLLS
ncbi:hypothetical protein R1sor_025716 [Riccia sorocarpa]|uniref:Uncharacterized protein n=1 Tax=Riccia sorocarpa TaxID=122646 RepID=A0ABD3G9E1_9MARC